MASKPSAEPQRGDGKEDRMHRRTFLRRAAAGTLAVGAVATGATLYLQDDSDEKGAHDPERQAKIDALTRSIDALVATIGSETPEGSPDAKNLKDLAQRCSELNRLLAENPSAMTAFGQTKMESSLSARTDDQTLRSLGVLSSKDAACFQEYLATVRESVTSVLREIRACPDAYVTPEIVELEVHFQQQAEALTAALRDRIRDGQRWMQFARQDSRSKQSAPESGGAVASIIAQGKKALGIAGDTPDPRAAERLALEEALVSDDKRSQDAIRSLFETVNLLQQRILLARVKETWDRQVSPSFRDQIRGVVGEDPASAERRKFLERFVHAETERRKLYFSLLRELHRRDAPVDKKVVPQSPATKHQQHAQHEMAVLVDGKRAHLHRVLHEAFQTLEGMGNAGFKGRIEEGWSALFGTVNAFMRNAASTTGSPDSMLPEEVTGPLMKDSFEALGRRLTPHLNTARPLAQRLSDGDASVIPALEDEFRKIDDELIVFCRQFNEGIDTAAQRAAILKKYATYMAMGAVVLAIFSLAGPQLIRSGVKASVKVIGKFTGGKRSTPNNVRGESRVHPLDRGDDK